MILIKNAAIVALGNVISQFIQMCAYVTFAREYSLSQFGMFSVAMSSSMIVGAVFGYRYELAVLLPKSRYIACLGLSVSAIVIAFNLLLSTIVMGGLRLVVVFDAFFLFFLLESAPLSV